MAVVGLDTLLGHRWAEARIKLCCHPGSRQEYDIATFQNRAARGSRHRLGAKLDKGAILRPSLRWSGR